MSTPRERLEEASHKLAGAAETIEDYICDGDMSYQGDKAPAHIREGLEVVKQHVKEIEEIIK